ncbi:hypothetical protein ACLRDC_01145 [Gluconacetobacter sacchari]|uniref:Uncharacterized protein n=2 Tax=Gluconacetobacter sacchari TaxID=92759 RepID=A0A7W4IB73_9PROT|nr:hypothetical protein [Gluconacetobacter sacchari]MBB2159669.1 hypothetical protein [Gluconacetobacter sacchari]GBQ27475.1 hypothetical protein AA12717_2694 [Gluconacetobacter sacchari DSM 12717]
MSNGTKPTPPKPDEKKPDPVTEHEDANLDEDLRDSFPASDPSSSGRTASN